MNSAKGLCKKKLLNHFNSFQTNAWMLAQKELRCEKDLDLIFVIIRLGLIHKHQQYKSPSPVKRSFRCNCRKSEQNLWKAGRLQIPKNHWEQGKANCFKNVSQLMFKKADFQRHLCNNWFDCKDLCTFCAISTVNQTTNQLSV